MKKKKKMERRRGLRRRIRIRRIRRRKWKEEGDCVEKEVEEKEWG